MTYFGTTSREMESFFDSIPTSEGRNQVLCQLLAEENITVHYVNARTASFDTINRILNIPMWRNAPKSVIDRMIAHEVGHALFTTSWVENLMKHPGPRIRSIANIVEDRMVDNKMRARYPGIIKDYNRGAKGIVEHDFCDLGNKRVADFNFIDRANLLSKLGVHIGVISFTDEEKVFINRMDNVDSTDESFALALEIDKFMMEQKRKEEEEARKQKEAEEAKKEAEAQAEESQEQEEAEESQEQAEPQESREQEEEDDGEISEEESEAGVSEEDDSTEYAEEPETDQDSTETESEEGDDDSETEEGDSVDDDSSEGEDESEESEETPESESEEGDGEQGEESDDQGDDDQEEQGEEEGEQSEELGSGADNSEDDDCDYGDIETAEMFENIQQEMDISVEVATQILDVDFDYSDYILHYSASTVQDGIKAHYYYRGPTEFFKNKIKSVKQEANLLYKEFSVRREATTRNQFSTDRGSIDMNRLAEYRTNDNIFINHLERVSNDENHRFVMLIDYSASMQGKNISYAMHQVSMIREFCLLAGIPFDVYLFSNRLNNSQLPINDKGNKRPYNASEYVIRNAGRNFGLFHVCDEHMSDKEFYVLAFMTRDLSLPGINMSNTPLCDSCKIMKLIVRDLKESDPTRKINFVTLTDGAENGAGFRAGTILTDERTKAQFLVPEQPYVVQLKLIKEYCHSVVGFSLAETPNDNFISQCINEAHKHATWAEKRLVRKELYQKVKKEGFANIDVDGFDASFVVSSHAMFLSNRNKENHERKLESLAESGSAKAFSNAFKAASRSKMIGKLITKELSAIIS